MSGTGPAWLQDDAAASAGSTSNKNNSYKPPRSIEPMEMEDPNNTVPEKVEDDEVPRLILYTRVINLILSVIMIVVSLLSLLTTQTATTGVLACYITVFSCLLCCFETHLKQIAKQIAVNFGFMYSAKARACFMIFMGTILFSFSLFGKIVGLCMLANAGFNFYIIFKYPSFEDAQRNDATNDIKGYLAANPAFASQITAAGMAASTEAIRNNPELAKQGAAALFSSKSSSDSKSRGEYATV